MTGPARPGGGKEHAISDRTRTQRLEADVTCLHCGHTAGLLRRELGETGAPTTFHDGGGGGVAVHQLSGVRCTHCRGPVCTGEYRVVDVYHLHLLERPRRGRPRKHPADARR